MGYCDAVTEKGVSFPKWLGRAGKQGYGRGIWRNTEQGTLGKNSPEYNQNV